jgi:hypothetical protein
MRAITTEPGKWLLEEYLRTPGDPKWKSGGLENTIIAIEMYAEEMERQDILAGVNGLRMDDPRRMEDLMWNEAIDSILAALREKE